MTNRLEARSARPRSETADSSTETAQLWAVSFRGEALGRVELSNEQRGFHLEGAWHPDGSIAELERVLENDGEAWISIELLGRARITSLPGSRLVAELAPACQAARR